MTTETPPEQAPESHEQPATRKWRRLALIFAIGAGVLVLLLVVALLRPWAGIETIAASTSPSAPPPRAATAEATATSAPPDAPDAPAPPAPAPAPPEPALAITSLAASEAAVTCANDSDAIPITFSWSSNGAAAWFGVDTSNAKAGPLQQVAPSGSFTWDFFCSNAATVYTVTVEGSDGTLVHRSVTVSRQ